MSICDGEMVNIGAALFVKVCWANHACAPNAFIVFNGSVASMRACKVIHPGEQILVSYTDSVTARRLRKSELLESYFFNCKCKLCTRIDDPLEMIFCQSCGVAGVPGVCSVCKSVMQLKDIDSSDISSIDTYKKCALKLAKTHWKLFKCRDRLIQSLLKSRDYLATIDMMQLQMDAYKSIFGPIYPMVTVNQLTIFKARLHLERFPDGGQECLAAFAKTHGSDHPLYIEALDNFRMLLHDADANNRAHTGEAGTGCDSCIY